MSARTLLAGLLALCACEAPAPKYDVWDDVLLTDLFLAGSAAHDGPGVRLVGGPSEAGAAWMGAGGALDPRRTSRADAVDLHATVELSVVGGTGRAGDGFTITWLDVLRTGLFVGADGEAQGAGTGYQSEDGLLVPGLPGWSVELDLFPNRDLPEQAAGDGPEPHVALYRDGAHRAPQARAAVPLSGDDLPLTVELAVRTTPEALRVWLDGDEVLAVEPWAPAGDFGLVGLTAGTGDAPSIVVDLIGLQQRDPD
jgi:hypothetical protein